MKRQLARLEQEYAPGVLSLFRRAIRYVAPFRFRFGVKFLLSVMSLLPALLLPWPVKIIIDHVILGIPVGGQPSPYPFFIAPLLAPLEGATGWDILGPMLAVQMLLILLIGGFGSSYAELDHTDGDLSSGRDTATQSENEANHAHSFAGGVFGLLEFWWTIRLTHLLNHHYRSRLFERIQSLPMTAFDDERIGDSVYRVMYDTPSITGVCYRLLLTPMTAAMALLLTVLGIYVTYPLTPQIALAALLFLPLSFLATWPWAARLRRRSRESREAGATTTSTVEEGISNILAVQSLGGEERERERFRLDSWNSFGRYRHFLLTYLYAAFTAGIPGALILAWAFVQVTDRIIFGELSPGDFTLLFTYFFQIATYAVRIGGTWLRVQNAAAGLGRVFFLMDIPGDADTARGQDLAPIRRGIRLENVSYTYDGGTAALRGVDLELRVGELVALVGPAGAGKTTLAYTIPRYVTPNGRVLADGVDLAGASLESLRSQIAFVFQETVLFDDTVAGNIRLGRPDASETDVVRAARLAGAHEFVSRLPQGYETRLGRSGGKLSVGQKQRIAIARALVRDAPVLILDEPTSALDPETELRLVNALREIRRERAVLVNAHRLSTIREADRIAFMADGVIVEQGTHAELMGRPGGAYRRYVQLQTRGAA